MTKTIIQNDILPRSVPSNNKLPSFTTTVHSLLKDSQRSCRRFLINPNSIASVWGLNILFHNKNLKGFIQKISEKETVNYCKVWGTFFCFFFFSFKIFFSDSNLVVEFNSNLNSATGLPVTAHFGNNLSPLSSRADRGNSGWRSAGRHLGPGVSFSWGQHKFSKGCLWPRAVASSSVTDVQNVGGDIFHLSGNVLSQMSQVIFFFFLIAVSCLQLQWPRMVKFFPQYSLSFDPRLAHIWPL